MNNIIIDGKCISKDNFKSFNKQGRYFLSKEYRAYELQAALQAKAQWKQKPLTGILWVRFAFFMPDKRHADLLNLPKSIADAMTGILWVDDKQIGLADLILMYDKHHPRVEINILQETIDDGTTKKEQNQNNANPTRKL